MINIKIYPVFWFALVLGLLICGLIALSGNRPTDGGFVRQDTPTAAARSLLPAEPPERDTEKPTPTPIVTVIYPTTGVSWTNTPVPPSATPIVIVIHPTFGTSIPPTP